MRLILQITSHQSANLGDNASHEFDEAGGTIGRAAGCSWTLSDPERFVSGTHASICFRGGKFLLIDNSTNGVFMNGSVEAVGRGNSVELCQGAALQIGDYTISVAIEQTEAAVDPWGWENEAGLESLGSDPTPTNPTIPGGASEGANQSMFDGPLPEIDDGKKNKIEPLDVKMDDVIPTNWWDEQDANVTQPGERLDADSVEQEVDVQVPPKPIQDNGLIPNHPAVETLAADANVNGLEIILQGLGIGMEEIPPDKAREIMKSFGEIFRVVVQGLMEVLAARSELKAELRMPLTTIHPVENNPLKFSPTPEMAIRTLLVEQGSGYLPPLAAIREGFQDIKDHQLALMAGMQAGFNELLRQFDPDFVENTLAKGKKKGGVLGFVANDNLWETYAEHYNRVADGMTENFNRIVGDEFARAYEEQIHKLGQARHSPKV